MILDDREKRAIEHAKITIDTYEKGNLVFYNIFKQHTMKILLKIIERQQKRLEENYDVIDSKDRDIKELCLEVNKLKEKCSDKWDTCRVEKMRMRRMLLRRS